MYLLDTNIIIFLLKGNETVTAKIQEIGLGKCFISEISVAELKYGAEKSERPAFHKKIIAELLQELTIVPIYNSLDFYAQEKARLAKIGQLIDDFDLLIGSTAVENNLILVSNNVKHLNRINTIIIENWLQ
jgi:tRNA(fMet)-specific endonuclease VapC